MWTEDGQQALRIALPSKGRLQQRALELLRAAGLRFRISGRRLFAVCSETGTRIIFSNAADIPVLVAEGVVDLGITGSDQVEEKGVEVVTHSSLDFGRCHLAVAVHKDGPFAAPEDLAGKVVGAKFVRLAERYFEQRGIPGVRIIEIQGAVEVMVMLKMVDAIVEIVETGNSLIENDLVELDRVLDAEAILIGNGKPANARACEILLRRIGGVLTAARYSLLEYNCPSDRIAEATAVTPGYSSPTVSKLQDADWLSVKVLVEKARVQPIMDELEAIGCAAIIETELRHTRL